MTVKIRVDRSKEDTRMTEHNQVYCDDGDDDEE